MATAAYGQSRVSGVRAAARSLAAAWPGARAIAIPLAIVALALFLRTWRLEVQGWTPDTYEQLDATKRLIAGEFPVSYLYPPGVAITMAPFLQVLPATLASMQIVIIGSSLLLVAVSYVFVVKATGDRVAAALLALGVAIAPEFVALSRVGLFDLIGTTWIISAIVLVPALRGRGLWAFALYGVMLSIAINIRANNAAFLPLLVIYWCADGGVPFRPRAIVAAVLRRELLLALGVMTALSLLYAWIGGWTSNAQRAPFTIAPYAAHVAFYAGAEFGSVAGVVIAPLAALGASELWRRNRTLLIVAIYMLVVWPLVHAPLPFINTRYMLAPLLFALMLAAHAPAAIARMGAGWEAESRRAAARAVIGGVVILGLGWAVFDGAMLYTWPDLAAQSHEAAYRQLRPVVAQLPPGSLFVSPGTRGVRDSNTTIEYLDVMDYSIAGGGNPPERIQGIADQVAAARADGRAVYYLYTPFEGLGGNLAHPLTRNSDGAGGPGYDRYYDGITARFGVTEAYRTTVKYFILYRVD
jgi:hypothetical protein